MSGWAFAYKLQSSVRGFFGEEARKSEEHDVRPKQLSLQVMPISQPEHVQW
jgi:predicted metal-dependent hydrolase